MRYTLVITLFHVLLAVPPALAQSSIEDEREAEGGASAESDHGQSTLDVTLGGQWQTLSSSSVDLFTTERTHFHPRVGLAWNLTEDLGVHAAWTGLALESGDVRPASLDLDTVTLGASYRYRLAWRLFVYGAVDLEAQHASLELSAGGGSGSQRTWAFGATPRAGLELHVPVRALSMHLKLRLYGGYAFRMDHSFDAVALDTQAASSRPLDLGAANLSGMVLGFSLAVGL